MFAEQKISTSDHAIALPGRPGRRRAGTRSWLLRLFDGLLAWHTRHQQRQHLRQLDDRMLKDIGLSRADVGWECAKPFWRP